MAHKKGVGSSNNGRESHSKRLGVKIFGGQSLIAGNVKGVSSVDDNGLTAPAAPKPAAAAPAQAATRYYTIKSGDSLSKIAEAMYGDSGQHDKIFEANREVIGDPDKIYPGQSLRIPAL